MIRRRSFGLAIGALAFVAGCSSTGARVAQAPAAPARTPAAAPAEAEAKATTPEDALLARIDQMQKVEFFRNTTRGNVRPKVAPSPFKIGDLPVARLAAAPHLEDYKPQTATPPRPAPKLGPAEPEIVIAPWDAKEKVVPGAMRNVRLSVRAPAKADGMGPGMAQLVAIEQLRRGPGGSNQELVEHCGDGYAYDRWIPIRWNRLSVQRDGLHVGVGDAVFDRVACSVHTIQHVETTATRLVPNGMMYGFRACGESCVTRESLVVVTPHASNAAASSLGGDPIEQLGLFSFFEIPIEHGGGGSFVASVTSSDVVGWHKALLEVNGPEAPNTFVMGVEVTQSVREAEPFAIAYIESKDPPPTPVASPILPGKVIDLSSVVLR